MKKIGRINIIMLVLSAFVLICYLPYFCLVVFNGEAFTSCLIPFTVVVAASLPALLFIKYRDRLNRFFKSLRIVYISGMCFYFVTFLIFGTYIGICASVDADTAAEQFIKTDGSGEGDIVLVFGCRTYGYTPSWQLKSRLDTAYELLEALPDSVCIVSGGEGVNEGVAEAYSMCEYLVARGIDRERIYTEPDSTNTYENIEFSMALAEKKNLRYERVIGVSSDFHLPRVKYLFDYYDVWADVVSAPSRDFWQFFMSIVREYMAYVKLFLVTSF
ncbi:MAG: YdcF family protein [Ruminococcaceae bacterium]|nr:YdcF family protein [Oscillospiraceae bacterium]